MSPRPIVLFGICLSMVTGVALGVIAARQMLASVDDSATVALTEVARTIERSYVEDIDAEVLLDGALRGMLAELDLHSSYLDQTDYAELQAETSGGFVGVGIEVAVVDDRFRVVAPLKGGPAEQAGIESGDVITAVDGQGVEDKRLMDLIRLLRGDVGEPVSLSLERAGEAIEISVVRDQVSITSIESRQLAGGVGYIAIRQFQIDTASKLDDALRTLNVSAGLILDLRDNPGGVLNASVAVADRFLDSGLIAYTEARDRRRQLSFDAKRGDVLNGAPLAVLINGASASAAEVVAGALADHDRATLIGTRTFGKGSVQTVLPLSGERALKLTTARYFTPSGRVIQGNGIEPDLISGLEGDALISFTLQALPGA